MCPVSEASLKCLWDALGDSGGDSAFEPRSEYWKSVLNALQSVEVVPVAPTAELNQSLLIVHQTTTPLS
jgi:hypothetical protein